MHIQVIISALNYGGTQKVASLLANEWVNLGHKVTIITFAEKKNHIDYDINTKINIINIGGRKSHIKLLFNMYKIYSISKKNNPDYIIGFKPLSNFPTIIIGKLLHKYIIISEHTNPQQRNTGLLSKILMRLLYPIADKLVVQSAHFADYFTKNYKIKHNNIIIAQNPIKLDLYQPYQTQRNQLKKMICISRLTEKKGLEDLIHAFHKLHSCITGWKLYIYGSGELHDKLNDLIKNLNIEEYIFLAGFADNVPDILQEADIFVQPSPFEGISNSLLEALASRLCSISTACNAATLDILNQGEYAIICQPNDINSLSQAMISVMQNDDLRYHYSQQAYKAVEFLDAHIIAKKWLEA